jgi:hypothetical protein
MTDKTKSRYDIDNIPISQKTRDGLTPENINYIGTIGRMLSLQDEVIEEILDKHLTAINIRFDSIEKRLLSIETGASDREKRIAYLEKRASLPYMILRYGIVIAIGIGVGWILHSIFS